MQASWEVDVDIGDNNPFAKGLVLFACLEWLKKKAPTTWA